MFLPRIKVSVVNFLIRIFSYLGFKKNKIIDKKLKPLQFDNIKYDNKRKVNVSHLQVKNWLLTGELNHFIYLNNNFHKKGLEFFFSSYLLDLQEQDILLDAAGGASNYLDAVRLNTPIREAIVTDQIYEGITEQENGIKIVGGDISSIHLGDSSVDKIACHHSFEHFQNNKDIMFIEEAFRLLKKSGTLVIIPLFLSDTYAEVWNIDTIEHFDQNADLIIDKSATLPGADPDGHFSRIYNFNSLEKRILKTAENAGFSCEIIECEIDFKSIPDTKHNSHGSRLNNPTRALKMTKI